MRVLLLTTECFGAPGGIQSYGKALIRASGELVSEDGALEVLCLYDRPVDYSSAELEEGTTFHGFGGGRLGFIVAACRAALARPDKIILGHALFLPLAPLLSFLSGASVLCMLYGIEAWIAWTRLQKLGARFCEEFISISDYTRQRTAIANEITVSRIRLLPCCLDLHGRGDPHQSGLTSDGSRKLLSVARLASSDRYKGIDTVLEAVAILDDSLIDYWIVGDGDDRTRLESISAARGLEHRVHFLGKLTEVELQQRYAQCDLFVLPSSAEGFGIVYLEASSHRKPSLGAAAGATPEVILDGVTGVLVPPSNPQALAAAIKTLLSDPKRLEALGAAAFDRLSAEFAFSKFRANLQHILWGEGGSP